MVFKPYFCISQLKTNKMNSQAKNAADKMMFQLLAASPVIDKVKMQELFDSSTHADFHMKYVSLPWTKKNTLDIRFITDELVAIWRTARATFVQPKIQKKAGSKNVKHTLKVNHTLKTINTDTIKVASKALGLVVATPEVITKEEYMQIAAEEAGKRYDIFKTNCAIEFSKLMNVA